MIQKITIVSPGPNNTLIGEYGEKVIPPKDWTFLPAGDSGITRKVTMRGNFWRVQVKKGRRTISKGIWAHQEIIKDAQNSVSETRSTDAYKKKRTYALNRRRTLQSRYEVAFCKAVQKYLNFNDVYKSLELLMAQQVTAHAIPIGSGTVARTETIPIEKRGSKAVIAWMRHNTTAYDNLQIAHIKGERRAIRRLYAEKSVELLKKYREGLAIAHQCPLQKVLLSAKTKL